MRGAALPEKSVFGDAPAQAREEARPGRGGGFCGLVKRRNISDATIMSFSSPFRPPFRSHSRLWSHALNRASAGLETIIAKALHRAPAGESALLAWPVACGSAVAERTRALSFS